MIDLDNRLQPNIRGTPVINDGVSRNKRAFEGDGTLIALQLAGLFWGWKEENPGLPGRGLNLLKLNQHGRVAMILGTELAGQDRSAPRGFLRDSDFGFLRRRHSAMPFEVIVSWNHFRLIETQLRGLGDQSRRRVWQTHSVSMYFSKYLIAMIRSVGTGPGPSDHRSRI